MNYRQKHNYENLNKVIFDGEGEYDIPLLKNENITVDDFIGFNFAKSCQRPENKCVHFFIDDYQFNRLWNRPDAYIDLLKRFKAVFTPDFSLYTDFPKAIQIYNHYRKHWLGAYWQEHSIKVIPTITWSDESSYEWCFDGEPIGGAIAVSSVGTQKRAESKELFLKGYNEMLNHLNPTLIYFHGSVPDECKGNICRIEAYQEKLHKM
ncbi:MAG: DUF4417 domain-containing protein [Clostridia bacterium]|nr:DUF4417 domain-containing protein [Clostridia bacterium]